LGFQAKSGAEPNPHTPPRVLWGWILGARHWEIHGGGEKDCPLVFGYGQTPQRFGFLRKERGGGSKPGGNADWRCFFYSHLKFGGVFSLGRRVGGGFALGKSRRSNRRGKKNGNGGGGFWLSRKKKADRWECRLLGGWQPVKFGPT